MTYVKYGAIGLLVLALFVGGWYCGSRSSKTALEGFQAAQSANTAKAVLAERASAAVELARVNTILKGYDNAPIDPVVPGIAHRVFVYANATGCAVPSPGANPGGAIAASTIPAGDPEFERLSQAAFDAAAHDAKELIALQQAWPK